MSGNSTLNIIGSASITATNIQGQELEINAENNSSLATQRATAAAQYIIQYIQNNYNVAIDPSRIITTTRVGTTTTAEERYVQYSISSTTQ